MLRAETDREKGSSASRRLRHEGKVPGVLYGHGTDPISITIEGRALRAAFSGAAGTNAVIELEVGGEQHLAMAKEIQRHATRHTIQHIDFLIVNRDEVVTVDIPVHLTGEAVEVLRADGVVDHQLFTLTVHCKPGQIPNSIDVPIDALKVGDAIRVGDLKLPTGVTTEQDPEMAIVVGQPPQVSDADLVTEAEAEAAAEAAEGGEAAAGEEAAEGASGEGGAEGAAGAGDAGEAES